MANQQSRCAAEGPRNRDKVGQKREKRDDLDRPRSKKGKWEARQLTEIDEQKKGRSATNGGSGEHEKRRGNRDK